MKLPRQLQVGSDLWEVKFKQVLGPSDKGPGRETIGLCDGDDHMIYIKTGLPPKERLKTLLHELAHAIEYSWGIKIPHPLIYDLEEPLLRLLQDNFL